MSLFVRVALGALLAAGGGVFAQTLSVLSGDGQIVLENFRSTSPMVVQARDAAGNPMAGVDIEWSVPFGEGGVIGAQKITGEDGKAGAYFIATSLLDHSLSVKHIPVTAKAPFGQAEFHIITARWQQLSGQPAPPPAVELVKPKLADGPLTGKAGETLAQAVTIRVSVISPPQTGEALPNVGVRLVSAIDLAEPAPASCASPNGMVFTGLDGMVHCDVILVGQPGSYRVAAYVGESSITPWFRLTIEEGDGSGGGGGDGGGGDGGGDGGGGGGETPVPVSITTSTLPAGLAGVPYQAVLTATGGMPPYTWSATGSLPGGLNLNPNTGMLSGTPASATTAQFTVRVSDSLGASVTKTMSLSVTSGQPPPESLTIVTESLPGGVKDENYFAAILVQGGCVTPFNQGQIRVAAGSLPPGLQLSGSAIRGVPSSAGSYEFILAARDACAREVQRSFMIAISQAGGEPPPAPINASPVSLTFEARPGGSPPPARMVEVSSPAGQSFNAAVTTGSGGDWLQVTPLTGQTPASLSVSVDPSSLEQGTYAGEVIVQPAAAGSAATRIPVTLVVSGMPELLIAPLSLSFEIQHGAPPPTQQVISVGSSGDPFEFGVSVETEGGREWLLALASSARAPAHVFVAVNPLGMAPGTYRGTVKITRPGDAEEPAEVAVVLQIPQPSPRVNAVTNAGSFIPGFVAPGQIVVIYGANLGPPDLAVWDPERGEVPRELADTKVFFDGKQAPVIYTSAMQLAAVVPYEVAGRQFTTMKVSYRTLESDPTLIPVAAAAPGIFTLDGSQGAILNQNYSVNGAGNGAAAGEVIMIFGTGEGGTTGCPDGRIAPSSPLPEASRPVSVTIGGKPAAVHYAGGAPGLPCGVLQVNATVPEGLAPGAAPIILEVAGFQSQAGVTVAIRAAAE